MLRYDIRWIDGTIEEKRLHSHSNVVDGVQHQQQRNNSIAGHMTLGPARNFLSEVGSVNEEGTKGMMISEKKEGGSTAASTTTALSDLF